MNSSLRCVAAQSLSAHLGKPHPTTNVRHKYALSAVMMTTRMKTSMLSGASAGAANGDAGGGINGGLRGASGHGASVLTVQALSAADHRH